MSIDCRKIEQLLWLYADGNISPQDKAEVELHLTHCIECQSALETISLLKKSSHDLQEQVRSVDLHAFDSAVMKKIQAEKKPAVVPVAPSRQYIFRMALSFAAAAAIVFFVVKSISDLGRLTPPYQATKGKVAESGNERNTINIELKRNDQAVAPKKDLLLGSSQKEAAKPTENRPLEKAEVSHGAVEEKTAPSEEAPILAAAPKSEERPPEPAKKSEIAVAEAPAQVSEQGLDKITRATPESSPIAPGASMRGGRQSIESQMPVISAQKQSSFSILPNAVSQLGPDSINIEGVYLTSDNIPLNVQSGAASLSEVFTDTGEVQVAMPHTGMLVTIDKMPEITNMVIPEYPVWAKKQQLSGVVWIKAKIDKEGNVNDAHILSSSLKGVGFEDASLLAARQSKFRPAEADGKPLEVWIVYPVKFIYKQ